MSVLVEVGMKKERYVYLAILVVTILAIYGQVLGHEYINYDDDVYISTNPHVRSGLTWEGILWAFTNSHGGHWHPLTWISLALDCELFGLNAGASAMINVLFHASNSLLLFVIFFHMTRQLRLSTLVALIFALHPLHVESVAWIVERKDVLSTFFWMLTVLAYIRYVKRPGIPRLALVVVAFVAGLMSKPMVITLPALLLLLDIWPLGRLRISNDQGYAIDWTATKQLIKEKTPLWMAVCISATVTVMSQQAAGAISDLQTASISDRLATACVAYLSYIGQALYPGGLGVFYPLTKTISGHGVGAFLGLVCMTGVIVWSGQRRPYLVVGWLWYLIALTPVIGIVQVGGQAQADRFMYIPLVGLSVMLLWTAASFVHGRSALRRIAWGLSVVWITLLAVVTYYQVGHWKSTVTIFTRAIDVTTGNFVAHSNLGAALLELDQRDEALWHYQEAARINPTYPEAQVNLGTYYARNRQFEKAQWHFERALHVWPQFVTAWFNLGTMQTEADDLPAAMKSFERVLELEPRHEAAHFRIGDLFERMGEYEQAARYFTIVTELIPDYQEAKIRLGRVKEKMP